MNRKRGPSIEDVAREAGVSVATVSRALRGLPNVASTTREKVERVAEEIHYRADPSAARLATGRTKLVQLATPTVDGWYFSRFLAGAIGSMALEAPVREQWSNVAIEIDLVRLICREVRKRLKKQQCGQQDNRPNYFPELHPSSYGHRNLLLT